MSLYDRNIKALITRYPELESKAKSEKESTFIQSEEVGGKMVFYANMDGRIFLLDSLYESEAILTLFRDNISADALYTKFFLFGIGNGMMVRKLLDTTDSTDMVFVYEPDLSILKHMMKQFDMTSIFADKKFNLIVGNALSNKLGEELSKYLTYTDVDTLQLYVYPNYNYIYTEEYLKYLSEFDKTLLAIRGTQDVIGRHNEANFENTFANYKYLCDSKSLEDLYRRIPEGKTAIVVASGPSLDKNVSELKNAKNKAFIIAADSALRTLLAAGVMPDMCVSVDAKKLSKHFSNDLANDVPMVCQLTSNREILASHRADKFFLNDLNHHVQHYFSRRRKVFPVMASGGSVANDAFSICQMLGIKTIILVGQDLAYTDNKTHSEVSVRGEWKIDVNTLASNVMTEDIYGNPILSSSEFTLYKDWIEEQIVNNPDLTVIDATEGGAKIHGSEIITLKEAIDKYCRDDFYFERAISDSERFMTEEETADFLKYMEEIPEELEKCRLKTIEGIRLYEQMLKAIYADKYRNQSFKTLFDKIQDVTDYLEKTPVMEYVKNHIQRETTEFLNSVYQTQQNERAELIDSCNIGVDYLKMEKKGIEELIPQIREKLNS